MRKRNSLRQFKSTFELLEDRRMLANFVVDSPLDDLDFDYSAGKQSLREAIHRVNLSSDSTNSITFASSLLDSTITVGSPLRLRNNTTITGLGMNRLTIDGGAINGVGGSAVFLFDNLSSDPATVTISDLTIQNGESPTFGGGIFNKEKLTIDHVNFINNIAADDGGAVYNLGGTVTITNSQFSQNSAKNGGAIANDPQGILSIESSTILGNKAALQGGAIFNDQGTITITQSAISGNNATDGGGIYNNQGEITIVEGSISKNTATNQGGGIHSAGLLFDIFNSSITENKATQSGGGIFNNGGTLTLTDSTISGNQSTNANGGGIRNELASTLNITSSTINGNLAINGAGIETSGTTQINTSTISGNKATGEGGGLWHNSTNLNIDRTTISDNISASDGAGVYSEQLGNLIVTNSTISGNQTQADGGGIRNNGSNTTITNTTISSNQANNGGGIANENSFSLILNSTTIALNEATNAGGGISIDLVDVSSLAQNTLILGNLAATDKQHSGKITVLNSIVADDASLEIDLELKDNGGPTKTHALLTGSSAIDAGDASLFPLSPETTDQRGIGFPRIFGNKIDIGAAEFQRGYSQITNLSGGDSFSPFLSADGKSLAFISWSDHTGNNTDENEELFFMEVGGDILQITDTLNDSSSRPRLSADGTKIVFVSDADLTGNNSDGSQEVFLFEFGLGFQQITSDTNDGIISDVRINNDATIIAFTSDDDYLGTNNDGSTELYLFDTNLNSNQLTQITSTQDEFAFFDFSIDGSGKNIVFTGFDDYDSGKNPNGYSQLFLFKQGQGITQLTSNTEPFLYNDFPQISRDGKRIVFESSEDITGENSDGSTEIFFYDVGFGFTQLTDSPDQFSFFSEISGNGKTIAFYSGANLTGENPSNFTQIFVYQEGIGFSQITDIQSFSDSSPSIYSINHDGTSIGLSSYGDIVGRNTDLSSELFIYKPEPIPGNSIFLDGDNLVIQTTSSDDVVIDNELDIKVTASGDLIITDTSDTFLVAPELKATGEFTNSVQFNIDQALANFQGKLIVNAGNGNDSLTIDISDGPLGVELDFNGGTQKLNGIGDTLKIISTTAHSRADFDFDNSSDGSIEITGNSKINYTGLEPIFADLTAQTVILNYSSKAEIITVTDGGNSKTTIDSTYGEILTINNPTGNLTIDSGGGGDQVELSGVGANFNATLEVYSDDVEVLGKIDTGSGEIIIAPVVAGADVTLGEQLFQTDPSLNLTQAELQQLNTNSQLKIGDALTGNLEVLSPLDLSGNTPKLALTNGVFNGTLILNDTKQGALIIVNDLELGGQIAPAGSSNNDVSITGNVTLKTGIFNIDIGEDGSGRGARNKDSSIISDSITASGQFNINSGVLLNFVAIDDIAGGEVITLVNRTGGTGTFIGKAEGSIYSNFGGSGLDATLSYQGGDGDDITLTISEADPPVFEIAVLNSPSQIENDGSIANVPNSMNQIHEWQDVYVEIYAKLPQISPKNIGSINFEMTYDTANVSFEDSFVGSWLTNSQITDSAGSISFTADAATTMSTLGKTNSFLVARLRFDADVVANVSGNYPIENNALLPIMTDAGVTYENELNPTLGLFPGQDQTVIKPIPYDISDNDVVDLSDLVSMISNFGDQTANTADAYRADFNRDGVVSLTDLVLLIQHFGASENSGETIEFPMSLERESLSCSSPTSEFELPSTINEILENPLILERIEEKPITFPEPIIDNSITLQEPSIRLNHFIERSFDQTSNYFTNDQDEQWLLQFDAYSKPEILQSEVNPEDKIDDLFAKWEEENLLLN